jgi:hypothetical protein
MAQKICTTITNGRECGFLLVEVTLPLSDDRKVYYCKNKKCDNYYKCSCGMEFGKHFPQRALPIS